ncbi:hypothetical protein ACFXO7_38765, partial [Nocardia tengchongensis]|uniref:hypothetical protein n=1 Tax=Nocardia tengchongensis TaxID=2055889 RepID=UPI0036A645D2
MRGPRSAGATAHVSPGGYRRIRVHSKRFRRAGRELVRVADGDEPMIEVPRHGIDAKSIREVDEGSVAPVVYRSRRRGGPGGPAVARARDGVRLAALRLPEPAAVGSPAR